MNNTTLHNFELSKQDRLALLGQSSPVVWLTGLSGAGKSTIANELAKQLYERGYLSYILDGDNIRRSLNRDLGFSDEDRRENIRRVAEVAKLISDAGAIVITSFISPFIEEREKAKELIGEDNFIEAYVHAPLFVCESRDPKGLYKKARLGKIPNFTGIDSPYEAPKNPDLLLETEVDSAESCAAQVIAHLEKTGKLKAPVGESWSHVNFGGKPTSNEDQKYAIFVGRFQPYHKGHIELIQQKLNAGIPALILVRDIAPDESNPFTTEQTVNMIEKYHAAKGDDVRVMIIPDIESVNFGRGVGYEVNEYMPPAQVSSISATQIRNLILQGNDSWREMVDSSIQEDVVNYLTT